MDRKSRKNTPPVDVEALEFNRCGGRKKKMGPKNMQAGTVKCDLCFILQDCCCCCCRQHATENKTMLRLPHSRLEDFNSSVSAGHVSPSELQTFRPPGSEAPHEGVKEDNSFIVDCDTVSFPAVQNTGNQDDLEL